MWLWLNQNAGAVQALAAVLMFIVTTVLCWVIWLYVRFTNTIAETARRQLSASIQPVVSLEILDERLITERDKPLMVGGRVGVKNLGTAPLKIRALSVVVRFRTASGFQQTPYTINPANDIVLMPDDENVQKIWLHTDIDSQERGECTLALALDCVDLAGVSEHSFFYDPAIGLRHFFGFRQPLSRHARAWRRFKELMRKLKKLGEVDDALRPPPAAQ
jgi:hypothetical protein